MYKSKYHHSPILKHILTRMGRQPRGQSFIELILVLTFLALLLAGMVEFGFLLNNYLHVLDGSREAARFASTSAPFTLANGALVTPDDYNPPFYYLTAVKAANTMSPVMLDPSLSPDRPDDIVISVFSLTGTTPVRFPENPGGDPSADPSGWSLCTHYSPNDEDATFNPNPPLTFNATTCPVVSSYQGFADYLACIGTPIPLAVSAPAWSSDCVPETSQFSKDDITNLLGSLTPKNSGVVLVEIFYNYPQLLKLPVLTNVLPDPIPLYVYSIMPISAAEPTQVPTP